MEWFKIIPDFNEEEEDVWNGDGSVLLDLTAWKDRKLLEDHMNEVYDKYSVGIRKGYKNDIKRFVDEADEFMMQVGNESFYDTSKEYKDDTITNLQELWDKACKVYFNNKDGVALYSLAKANKNPKPVNAKIKFGPWVLWKKNEWDNIKYGFKKWKRLKKRNKDSDKSLLSTTNTITQSQRDRGRKDTRNNRSDDDKDKDKSRSRSRKSTSSRSRKQSKRRKTSSTSNPNLSSDGADSQASIV